MVAGLTPVMPSGALYMMVGIELDKFPHISTGIDFMEKLMLEESVYILPGEVRVYSYKMTDIVAIYVSAGVSNYIMYILVFLLSGLHQIGVVDAK